jgi:hypothetical protein
MTHFLRSLAIFTAAIAIAGCGSVSVVPADITGTIVDTAKAPWPGRQVLVGDTLTTTDEAGHFTVHDVSPPYDLAIASGTTMGDVYVGMSDPAPMVVSRGIAPGSPAQSGSMTVTVVLPAADTSTVVGWVVLEATDILARITVVPVTTATGPVRTFNVDWGGPPPVGVRIHAFQTQVDPATSAPVHYLGYDTTNLVLDGQGNVTWTASYKPPPFSESPLSLTVSLPAGYAISHTWLLMRSTELLGTAGQIGSGAAGPEISLVVPDLPGGPFLIDVATGEGYGMSRSYVPALPAGTQKLAVPMEPTPTLISPPDGATFGVGSTITWTLGGPGAPFTTLNPLNSEVRLITLWGGEDGSVTVPDLSALGLPLPHGVTCDVAVWRDSRATTAEDFASGDYLSAQSLKPYTLGASTASVVTTR